MKRVILSFLMIMVLTGIVSANCILVPHLVNQEPYPAIPGETVELLFQVRGTDNRDCKDVVFILEPEFPFYLGPEQDAEVRIKGGTYVEDFNNFMMIPFKVRIDKDAVEGKNEIKVKYSRDETRNVFTVEKFDVEIRDVRTDFEIFVRDYDASQNRITFEILNSGKNDVEALTIEIPRQENIKVKGANRNIVGFLDATDFTTANFEATPFDGEIKVIIHYTDIINERRSIEKTVLFEEDYFIDRLRDRKETNPWIYIVGGLVILFVAYWAYGKIMKARKKKRLFDESK